ncbi:hypothetical protein [Streptomyces sp. B6B3]|uniref:hypothetical protein n=1 Tax=Streptomyces sp. B6B3 TaxID=3153570 RepID=UPI00325E31BC
MSRQMAARGTGGRRRQRTVIALAAFTVLGLGLVGCGGDSEASDGSSGEGSADDREAAAVAYSECMRENGVPEFPDPQGGRLTIQGGQGQALNPQSPEFQAAEQACADLKPPGLGQGGNAQQEEAMLAYSQCMRDNGVPEFPDPEGGMLRLSPDSGVDLDSPEFQQAEETCRDLAPGATGQ